MGGTGKLATTLFEDCTTVDDLLKRAVQLYGSYRCLGTRDLLSEEDEMQSNGKIFKKVRTFIGFLRTFDIFSENICIKGEP